MRVKTAKASADSVKPLHLTTTAKPALVGKSKLEAKNVSMKVTVNAPPPAKPNMAKMAPKEFAKFRNNQVYKGK